jgi:hypothetical protein
MHTPTESAGRVLPPKSRLTWVSSAISEAFFLVSFRISRSA